jgi:proline iminopeptidase
MLTVFANSFFRFEFYLQTNNKGFRMKNLLISLLFFAGFAAIYSQVNVKIESGGAELNTWIYPKSETETVIILHGGPGVPTPMDSVINYLKNEYQVIFFQQRGTGNSFVKNDSYTIADYLLDINSIANYFELEKFHLFGHSWGGLYAQIYAQEFPGKVLSLFLVSPSSGTGYQWDETEDEVMAFNKSKVNFWQLMSMGYFSVAGMLGSDGAYQCLFKIVLSNYNSDFNIEEQNLNWLEGVRSEPINATRKSISNYPILKNMEDPEFRVTITYGEKDIYGKSSEYVKNRYKGAQIFIIKNSGHIPWLHNRDRFIQILYSHFGIEEGKAKYRSVNENMFSIETN